MQIAVVRQNKQKNLNKALKKFERINKAYLKGVDTLEEYSINKSALLPEIENLKKEVTVLSNKVKNPAKLNWKEVYEETLVKFIEHPTEKDKKVVKMVLAKLIDRVEFRKKPFSVKVFYKTI